MAEIPCNTLAVKARLKGEPGIFQIKGVPGLHLAVLNNGRGSWRIRYRPHRGAPQRWFTFGDARTVDLGEAIKKARELLSKVQVEGKDPHVERRAAIGDGKTMPDLLPAYLAERKAEIRKRHHGEITRHLEKHWKPLHSKKLRSIARSDVVEVLDQIAQSCGKGAADRARSALSQFFTWAIDRTYAENNPTLGIKPRNPKPAKNRTLSDAELVEVWDACPDDDFGKIVKLLILTLQRRGEIGNLELSEIDAAARQILLPEHRTKNGRPHIIPLSTPAWEILESVPRREGRDLLFGRGAGGFGGWTKSKADLDERIAKARKKAGNAKPMPAWTLHDLRRTGSTNLHERKFAPPHVVEAILNHVSGHQAGVAGVYNKAQYLDERREALEAWGQFITKRVSI